MPSQKQAAGTPTLKPLQWGIEEMGETLYVGPMRRFDNKLADIAFTVEMDGYHSEAKRGHRKTAKMICKAVNEHNERNAK